MINKDDVKNIVLLGQPNAGKSTLYNVLSDIKTATSNFAGTSVKVAESQINIFGYTFNLIDLPGTYSLNYTDQAEKVTYDFLMNQRVDLIINVVDASLLARSLEFTSEIIELGIPMVIALNMMDEAEQKGLKIDHIKLSELLNIKVVPITAIFGKGVRSLVEEAYNQINSKSFEAIVYPFTAHIENHISSIIDRLSAIDFDSNGINLRYYAIKSIEHPNILESLNRRIDLKTFESDRQEIEREHKIQSYEAISYERHHIAMSLAEKISKFTKKERGPFSRKIDNYLLDPIFGYFALFLFLGVMFFATFYIGSVVTSFVDPYISEIMDMYKPLESTNVFLYLTVDGLFQGIAGIFGIVLPYFLPLIIISSLFEESGYIARVAFLIDSIFNKIGLNGKSVAAFMMGFGCNIPAIYATRILESHRDRLLSAILIPFIPCSARVSVIFALTAAFAGPLWAIVIFLFVLIVIAINGKILSKYLKKPTGMVLEIPELRAPSFKISLTKTYYKLLDFIKEASPYLVIGSIILAYIQYYNVAIVLNYIFYPILHYILNIPSELGATLIFGFLRKELILVMANQAMGVNSIAMLPMSYDQVIVFIVFVTLYFPCITTFYVLVKEFGYKVAFISAGLSILVATLGAFMFRIYFDITKLFF